MPPPPPPRTASYTGRRTAQNAPFEGVNSFAAAGLDSDAPARVRSKTTKSRAAFQLSTSCSAVFGMSISKWAAASVCSPIRKSRTWYRKGFPSGSAPGV